MQSLYATRLRITAKDVEHVRRSVLADVASWAWRDEAPPPDLLAEPGSSEADGYKLSWRTIGVDDHSDAVTRVSLVHADEDHVGIEWVTSLDVVSTAGEVRTSVQIQRRASQMRIAPAALELHRPRIVPALIQHHDCDCGDGIAISPIERVLEPGHVDDFVKHVLTLPERALPVLILSVPIGAEAPLADARYLADALSGLAHVYVLSGHLSWERLRDTLGPRRLVPRSGARLFWPGLGADGDSLRHPFWGPAALRHRPGRRSFGRHLFSILSPLSVLRVPADPAIPGIQRAYAMRSFTDIAAQSAEEATAIAGQRQERIEELQEQVDGLSTELETTSSAFEETKAELLRQKANWNTYKSYSDSDANGATLETEREPASVESWDDVAELVEVLADSDAFFFTPAAEAQLKDNDYSDPARMLEHLEALADAAEAFHNADGQTGGRFEDWIRTNFEIEVSLHDRALEQAGGDKFDFEGETYSREPHVKVDDAKAFTDCGRIYFALDTERNRFIVDHIGLHL